MLTCCQLCGGDTNELLLLGASADKVCRETFGQSYSGSSCQRIPHGICDKCKAMLDGGAACYICPERQAILMFSAECVSRNGWPGAGKVSRLRPEDMAKLQAMVAEAPAPGVEHAA